VNTRLVEFLYLFVDEFVKDTQIQVNVGILTRNCVKSEKLLLGENQFSNSLIIDFLISNALNVHFRVLPQSFYLINCFEGYFELTLNHLFQIEILNVNLFIKVQEVHVVIGEVGRLETDLDLDFDPFLNHFFRIRKFKINFLKITNSENNIIPEVKEITRKDINSHFKEEIDHYVKKLFLSDFFENFVNLFLSQNLFQSSFQIILSIS
jgi:hypothetical protein